MTIADLLARRRKRPDSVLRNGRARGPDLYPGMRFGMLMVLGPSPGLAAGSVRWTCKCDCGGVSYVPAHSLFPEDGNRSCGCQMHRRGHRSEPIGLSLLFWVKVGQRGECWEWTGSLGNSGYGRYWSNGRSRLSHRAAYEELIGPIPDGWQLDHLCRNTRCVNPLHLEPVTPRENTLRGIGPSAINARKTHCRRGHEFSDENTASWGVKRRRWCRACAIERNRLRNAQGDDNI